MWAVDTNLLVRYYTQDDPRQSTLAMQWLEQHAPNFVPLSVVLELHWVLEHAYRFAPAQRFVVFDHLINSPAFAVESQSTVKNALAATKQGLEFADALHLASSAACEGFASFDDRGFARKAKRLGLKPSVSVPAASKR